VRVKHLWAWRQFRLRVQGAGRRHLPIGVRHLRQCSHGQPPIDARSCNRALQAFRASAVCPRFACIRDFVRGTPTVGTTHVRDFADPFGAPGPSTLVQTLGGRRRRPLRHGSCLCPGPWRTLARRACATHEPGSALPGSCCAHARRQRAAACPVHPAASARQPCSLVRTPGPTSLAHSTRIGKRFG
jgi:hypothetical protein